MSDFKIVYLIVEREIAPNRQTFWRPTGNAFVCRDGSLNLKLDIHPGLAFNIRDPKSSGERFGPVASRKRRRWLMTKSVPENDLSGSPGDCEDCGESFETTAGQPQCEPYAGKLFENESIAEVTNADLVFEPEPRFRRKAKAA